MFAVNFCAIRNVNIITMLEKGSRRVEKWTGPSGSNDNDDPTKTRKKVDTRIRNERGWERVRKETKAQVSNTNDEACSFTWTGRHIHGARLQQQQPNERIQNDCAIVYAYNSTTGTETRKIRCALAVASTFYPFLLELCANCVYIFFPSNRFVCSIQSCNVLAHETCTFSLFIRHIWTQHFF